MEKRPPFSRAKKYWYDNNWHFIDRNEITKRLVNFLNDPKANGCGLYILGHAAIGKSSIVYKAIAEANKNLASDKQWHCVGHHHSRGIYDNRFEVETYIKEMAVALLKDFHEILDLQSDKVQTWILDYIRKQPQKVVILIETSSIAEPELITFLRRLRREWNNRTFPWRVILERRAKALSASELGTIQEIFGQAFGQQKILVEGLDTTAATNLQQWQEARNLITAQKAPRSIFLHPTLAKRTGFSEVIKEWAGHHPYLLQWVSSAVEEYGEHPLALDQTPAELVESAVTSHLENDYDQLHELFKDLLPNSGYSPTIPRLQEHKHNLIRSGLTLPDGNPVRLIKLLNHDVPPPAPTMSIVRIERKLDAETVESTENSSPVLGSGFFVSLDGVILIATCNHILKHFKTMIEAGQSLVNEISFVHYTGEFTIHANLVWSSWRQYTLSEDLSWLQNADIALFAIPLSQIRFLKGDEPVSLAEESLPSTDDMRGQKNCTTWGYPVGRKGHPKPINDIEIVNVPAIEKAAWISIQTSGEQTIVEGLSGAPLWNRYEKVIGMINGFYNQSRTAEMISLSRIRKAAMYYLSILKGEENE